MKTSYLRENIRRILREESSLSYNPIKTIIKEVSNGNIPDSNLIAIDTPSGGKGTAKLNSKAAKDFNDMVKAAKSENVEILVSQGYRPLGSKEKGCSEGFTQWCAWIKYKSGKGNLAAKPGTSNHGKGSAIDVKNCKKGTPLHNWLVKNASKFNFRPLASEAWHWDHSSSKDMGSTTVDLTTPDTTTNTDSKNTDSKNTDSKDNDSKDNETPKKLSDIIKRFFASSGLNPETTDKTSTKLSDTESSNKPLPSKTENNTIILMGGLDYRSGDLNIKQQTNKINVKLPNKNVLGFRYNDLSGVLAAIKNNPYSYVILFSAGCNKSSTIANAMKDKQKLFIVEPYATSKSVTDSVSSAVSSGVPSSNVVVGPNKPRGNGVVGGATKTPTNLDHWGALDFVTTLIK
jgi:hypothetical protein